jgi:D-arabinose 5-phosphate isomerase GutQ
MDPKLSRKLDKLSQDLPRLRSTSSPPEPVESPDSWVEHAVQQRANSLAASVVRTVKRCADLEDIVCLLLRWMQEGAVVRVLGAGRARLAAAIPANRLAHGGARVYVQDDIIPMPHTIKGGGVIAASASGRTRSVLDMLKIIQEEAPQITVLGIAAADADEFRESCHYFIGIEEEKELPNPLRALADVGEYVISEVLDALVVAAGKQGGFDDRMWRLGHENVGATGPYDSRIERFALLLNEWY